MDTDLWFEEEIAPGETGLQDEIKGLEGLDLAAVAAVTGGEASESLSKGEREARIEAFVRQELRGRIGIHQPMARRVMEGEALPEVTTVGGAVAFTQGTPYLVRLGVEFELTEKLRAAGYRYEKLWCKAWLRTEGPPYLRILGMAPDKLFHGEARRVRVEVKPALTWGEAEFSLFSIAGDVQLGVVMPVVLAFTNPGKRENVHEPYWEITERGQAICGQHHFWLLLDLPSGCDPARVRLGVLGEGDVRGHLGRLPLGPEVRAWERRPSKSLASLLGG